MKCEIINRKLTIFPSNETELYAIKEWMSSMSIHVNDQLRSETKYIRGSVVKIDVSTVRPDEKGAEQ